MSVLCFAIGVASAEQIVVADFSSGTDADGVPKGWDLKEKSGRADLRITPMEGTHALQFRSTNTSFSVQRSVDVDAQRTPYLTWKWKVNEVPEGGDFRRTKTDDQAAQLFVAFSRTQSIVYLWDSSAPEGLMAAAPSPPFMSIKAVVVRSGKKHLGEWLTETRNVLEDYKHFFGEPKSPLKISGVRLQINTQHTQTSGESFFADVAFKSENSEKRVAEK